MAYDTFISIKSEQNTYRFYDYITGVMIKLKNNKCPLENNLLYIYILWILQVMLGYSPIKMFGIYVGPGRVSAIFSVMDIYNTTHVPIFWFRIYVTAPRRILDYRPYFRFKFKTIATFGKRTRAANSKILTKNINALFACFDDLVYSNES